MAVHCVKFSPDGKYLASGGEDKKIMIFDVVDGRAVRRLVGNTASVKSMTWHSSSKALLVGCTDGTVRYYELDFSKPKK